MKNSQKFGFVIVMIMVIAGSLVYFSSKTKINSDTANSGSASSDGNVAGVSTNSADKSADDYTTKLAQALTLKGMVMYGSANDDQTKSQKNLFGDAFSKVDYVECDASLPNANVDECAANNIVVYPTWVYQEKSYEHQQTLADLAQIINFDGKIPDQSN